MNAITASIFHIHILFHPQMYNPHLMLYSDIDDAYKNGKMMDGYADGGGGDSYTSTYGSEGADVDYLFWDNSKNATPPNANQRKILTHRDCLQCYFNPTDPNFQQSLKHIDSCGICKQELANMGNLGSLGTFSPVQQQLAKPPNKTTNEMINEYLQTDKKDKEMLNYKMDNIIQYLLQGNRPQPVTQQNGQMDANAPYSQVHREQFGGMNGKFVVECNFTNIALVLLIVLLLIDIMLRFTK
jgi:hypothetical protein